MLSLYALPSFFLLTLLLATSSLVSAQFDARTTPECCLTCWRSVRSSASLTVDSFANGHEMGGMPEWCDDQELVGELTSCWEDTCTDPNEIAVGRNAWNAACAYARSTAAVYSSVHSSAAAQTADVQGDVLDAPMTTLTTSQFLRARLRARAESGPRVGSGVGKRAQPRGDNKASTPTSAATPYSPSAGEATKEQRKRAL
ncbi:hypothetical protein JCM8115_002959 [Rhodotorula mucilaginosa]